MLQPILNILTVFGQNASARGTAPSSVPPEVLAASRRFGVLVELIMRARYLPADPELYLRNNRGASERAARWTTVSEGEAVNDGTAFANSRFHRHSALPTRRDRQLDNNLLKDTLQAKEQSRNKKYIMQPTSENPLPTMQKTYYTKILPREQNASNSRALHEEDADWRWDSSSSVTSRDQEEVYAELDSPWSIALQVCKDLCRRVWITINYNGFDDDNMAPIRTRGYGSASGRF